MCFLSVCTDDRLSPAPAPAPPPTRARRLPPFPVTRVAWNQGLADHGDDVMRPCAAAWDDFTGLACGDDFADAKRGL